MRFLAGLCSALITALALAWPAQDLAPLGSISGARAATIRLGYRAAPTGVDLTTGLAGYWPLTSAADNCRHDEGPNNAELTLYAGVTCNTAWTAFSAATTARAEFAVSGNLGAAGATKSAWAGWVYTTTNSQRRAFGIATGDGVSTRITFGHDASRRPVIQWRSAAVDPSGTVITVTGTGTAIPANTWTFLAFNWDADNNLIQAWVNDTLAVNSTSAVDALGTSTSTFGAVGGISTASRWAGNLARVRFFVGRTLDADVRAALLAEGAP